MIYFFLKFNKKNIVSFIIKNLINRFNYYEYEKPSFNIYNERSMEYGFVFEQITKFRPKTILDVGTGKSALPSLMANCGILVTATDNIKDYWKRGFFNQHYFIINDDIQKTKLKKKFDMITCISALEHMENYNDAIKNMFELLSPGGHLLLTVPYNEKKFAENVYSLPDSSVKPCPPHKTRAFSRKEIIEWTEKYSAQVAKQEYWKFFTGEYWTGGYRLDIPQKTLSSEKHQISCILFEKK